MQSQTRMGKGSLKFNSIGPMAGGGGGGGALSIPYVKNPEFMCFQFSVIIFVIQLLLSLNQGTYLPY